MSLLTLTPVDAASLPSPASPDYSHYRDRVTQAALALVASLRPPQGSPTSPPWTRRRVYHASKGCPTETYSTQSPDHPPPGTEDCDGLRWHARTSTHRGRPSFAHFEAGLLHNHSENEARYIDSCYEAKRLAVIHEGQLEVWQTKYTSPFPASGRDFVFALLTLSLPPRPSPSPSSSSGSARPLRSFLVVSIPVSHPDADDVKGSVRGRYVSVEEVREEDDGSIRWTMAVSSSAGGSLPRFITERAMPSKISEDVPSFLEWVVSDEGPHVEAGAV